MSNRDAARLADRMLEKYGLDAVSECRARAQYRRALLDYVGEAAWHHAALTLQQKNGRG